MRRLATICCLVLTLPLAAHAEEEIGRLLKGEILYQSLQANHLDALLRSDAYTASTDQLPASNQPSTAELQLALGLGSTVEKNIKKTRPDDKMFRQARNRDAYHLAWFYYNDRKPVQALEVLDSIEGKADGVSLSDIEYLYALAYINVGRFKAAANLLHELPLIDQPRGYTLYNLALAQLQSGNEERGRSTLASLGRINTSSTDLLALKDMANLKLGYRYLQEGSLEQARDSFNRVRLDGPFTNQALLGAGWTSFSMGMIERSVVAWSLLHEKEAIDDTIIEAKMALPYAYSKLGVYGKAANHYAHAIEVLDSEITRLETTSDAIRTGALSTAIVEALQARGDDWYLDVSGRNDKQAFFLPLLLSSEEFREQAGQLHELALIRHRIEQALRSTAAYIELTSLKRQHYATVLPETEAEYSAVNKAMKELVPDTSTQPGGPGRDATELAEISLLRQTYRNYLGARTAIADFNRDLPDYARELAELSKRLKRLDNKLAKAITQTAKQVEASALAILEQKQTKLQNYRNNALFALAESYDFATGKRQ